jgi:hypothetical protein
MAPIAKEDIVPTQSYGLRKKQAGTFENVRSDRGGGRKIGLHERVRERARHRRQRLGLAVHQISRERCQVHIQRERRSVRWILALSMPADQHRTHARGIDPLRHGQSDPPIATFKKLCVS